ncbi:MAG: ATP-binding cassette domain-containing protein, partial [Alphaproteobacteria bacterium]|nr:ATP-binding cassette domain-containing protein [Alphaproteobacteria bacterium]
STLLKVLSRITEPTTGTITMNGRIASLLEVGTGFHPELTGRENIFLNGSILGMSQREIKRKFDEIVDFAGVETFLDTPVKRYSSGMRMRLGFAVAANLESEILVIDEVLAVGDAEFQKKCLGKMDDVSRSEGRTILFVSHSMGAVQQLCSKSLVLSHGKMIFTGGLSQGIEAYFDSVKSNSDMVEWYGDDNPAASYNSQYMSLKAMKIVDRDGAPVMAPCKNNAPPTIQMEIDVKIKGAEVGYILYNQSGAALYASSTLDMGEDTNPLNKITTGLVSLTTNIPKNLLNEGIYTVAPFGFLRNDECFMHPTRHRNVPRLTFEIAGGMSETDLYFKSREGEFAPLVYWNLCEGDN